MNIIKKILPAGLATLVILLAVAFSTSADEVNEGLRGQRFNPEHREAVMETIKNNDYDAWYELLTKDDREPKILEYINADNFPRFCEMHQHLAEARAIAEELGLPQKQMGKKGFKGQGQRPELTDEQKEVLKEAHELMKAGDKEGAKELLEEAGIQFGKFQSLQGRHNGQGPMNQE